MLDRVGLPADAMRRFPSEFSDGQRQRVAIARALMPSPRLVICDEPVSALDLSVQAQVLNLLRGPQREYHLSYLFIAHNLAVVRHVSHRIVVLYHGRVMEQGPAAAVYAAPWHPYPRALLAADPQADPELQAARRAAGAASADPSAATAGAGTEGTGTGCPFAPRRPYAIRDCVTAQRRWCARPAAPRSRASAPPTSRPLSCSPTCPKSAGPGRPRRQPSAPAGDWPGCTPCAPARWTGCRRSSHRRRSPR